MQKRIFRTLLSGIAFLWKLVLVGMRVLQTLLTGGLFFHGGLGMLTSISFALSGGLTQQITIKLILKLFFINNCL